MTLTEPTLAAARVSPNPYLSGNFAPVDDELDVADLPVQGRIPEGLTGRLLRIGPNPVQARDPKTYHWFTGSGMVHGVRLRDGRAEWYRNRFVRDDTVTEVKHWPRTPGPRHGMGSGTANTNVVGLDGRTFAIVEAGGLPVELTYDLDTVQMSDFDGTLPGSFTAHPKRDPATGENHAVVYYWEWDYVQYVVVGTDGRVRKTVDIPVPGKPMVHDCAITESQVVIMDLPVTFDLDAAMSGTGTLPYSWNPDYGARDRPVATRRVEWRCHALVRGRSLLRVPPDERVRPAGRSRRVRRDATPEDVRRGPVRTERRRACVRALDHRPRVGTCRRGGASTIGARSSHATTSASSVARTGTATPLRSLRVSSTDHC